MPLDTVLYSQRTVAVAVAVAVAETSTSTVTERIGTDEPAMTKNSTIREKTSWLTRLIEAPSLH